MTDLGPWQALHDAAMHMASLADITRIENDEVVTYMFDEMDPREGDLIRIHSGTRVALVTKVSGNTLEFRV